MTSDLKQTMISSILVAEGGTKLCIFQGSSGCTITLPYFLIQFVLPELTALVSDQMCCQLNDVMVILPDVHYETLVVFKELVTVGQSSPVGLKALERLLRFAPNLELGKIECHDPLSISGENENDVSSDLEIGVDSFHNLICQDGDANEMSDEEDEKTLVTFQNLISKDDNMKNLEMMDDEMTVDTFQNLTDNIAFDNDILADGTSKVNIGNFNEGCSINCNSNCHVAVQSWADEDRLRLKQKFSCNKITETKEKLLKHLIAQDDIIQGQNTQYVVKGHQFCLDYFAFITGCSLYIVRKVLVDFLGGNRIYLHGNSSFMKSKSASTVSAICWLKSFSESYGQFSPDENVTVLSYWLTKQTLFNMYKEETPSPHISMSSFYDLFKTTFGPRRVDKSLPWIRISKYSTHSVCTICVALNCNQKQAKTEAELQQALDLRNSHRMNFASARRKVEEIRQSSLSFPSDNLFVQIDSMDNSKSYLPHYLEHSKDQVGKERLPSKITGCTLYSSFYEKKRKVIFYLNHDVYENGSNMIITIIYNLIKDFANEHDILPKKLHLNLDNCWKGEFSKYNLIYAIDLFFYYCLNNSLKQ